MWMGWNWAWGSSDDQDVRQSSEPLRGSEALKAKAKEAAGGEPWNGRRRAAMGTHLTLSPHLMLSLLSLPTKRW